MFRPGTCRQGRCRRSSLAIGTMLLSLSAFSPAHAAPAATLAASDASTPRLAYVTGTALSTPQVWLAASSGIQPRRLGPGDDPLLAPNGQSVAVALFGSSANSETGPSIGVYSALGTPASSYLELSTATATPLAFSPDSRYLAVARVSTAVTDIAAGSGLDVIDMQTGAVVSIAEGAIYGASFAPDGTDRVVFARSASLSTSAPTNLYVSTPDGSGLRRLTSDGRSLYPVWGPRYIAYDRERLRHEDAPVYQIWLQEPSVAHVRRLTNVHVPSLVSGLVPLAFSADGSRLLAEFGGQDTSEAWAVSVSSGHARRLTVGGLPVMGAGLSRDGHTVLIDEHALGDPASDGRVAEIPFTGGHSKVLVAHGSQASWNR